MDRARRNGDEFARPYDNPPVRKFDDQFPIDAKKCLVGVRMMVPGNCSVITLMRISWSFTSASETFL